MVNIAGGQQESVNTIRSGGGVGSVEKGVESRGVSVGVNTPQVSAL